MPGYTSEKTVPAEEELEQKIARLELSGVGGSWGALRIRCEASLFRLYRANSLEVEVRPDTPQPASVLLMGPSTSKLFTALAFATYFNSGTTDEIDKMRKIFISNFTTNRHSLENIIMIERTRLPSTNRRSNIRNVDILRIY